MRYLIDVLVINALISIFLHGNWKENLSASASGVRQFPHVSRAFLTTCFSEFRQPHFRAARSIVQESGVVVQAPPPTLRLRSLVTHLPWVQGFQNFHSCRLELKKPMRRRAFSSCLKKLIQKVAAQRPPCFSAPPCALRTPPAARNPAPSAAACDCRSAPETERSRSALSPSPGTRCDRLLRTSGPSETTRRRRCLTDCPCGTC